MQTERPHFFFRFILSLGLTFVFSSSVLVQTLAQSAASSPTSNSPTASAPSTEAASSGKWGSEIPPEAKDPKPWADLLNRLMNEQLYFAAVGVSGRMLIFFQDLPTKELAYRSAIELVD